MRHAIRLCLIAPILAFVLCLAMAASAMSYVHLADARAIAQNHVWVSAPCYQSSNNCWQYPFYTSYYQRVNDNYLRVEIGVGWYTCSRTKYGYRVFGVQGTSDSNAHVTTQGSNPYWACPG
jgi:hypothetical protein